MPNWCYNNVTFYGEKQNITNLGKLLDKTIDLEDKTHHGQTLFTFEGVIEGYMFSIGYEILDDDTTLVLTFDSRWSPIPHDVVRIAELFNLKFEYDYEESGMDLYGKYTLEKDLGDDEAYLMHQSLESEHINSCRVKVDNNFAEEEDDDDDAEYELDYEKLHDLILEMEPEYVQIYRTAKTE